MSLMQAKGPVMDHTAEIAKMNPELLQKMVEMAMSGKAGPEMQHMAQQAMQGPAQQQEPDGDEQPMAQGHSPFSDNDADDSAPAAAPQSTGGMFSGGR